MRWIVRLIGALVAVVVVAVAALFLLPSERIARLAAEQFTAATGRALEIGGEVRPTLWPTLGVRTGPVVLANADWSQNGPMLTADSLSIGVRVMPLLSGAVEIEEVSAVGANVLLERRADGSGNWELLPPGEAAAAADTTPQDTGAGGALPPIVLDRGLLENASLRFIDHGAGSEIALTALNLEVALPAGGEARATGTGRFNGADLSIDAAIGNLSAFLGGGVQSVRLAAGLAGAEVRFDGRAGLQPVAVEGDSSVTVAALGPLMQALGQAAPTLPGGLDRNIAASGRVTYTGQTGGLFLRGGAVTLGGNRMAVDLDLATAGRMKLTANLSGGALDLSAFTAGSGGSGGSGGGTAASGWSRAPIDVSGLDALDAEVTLSLTTLDLGLLKMGPIEAKVTLDRARMVADIARAGAYGGTISGQAVVNGRNGLSLGGDISARGVALQPLLTDFADIDRVVGNADLRVKYLMAGNSLDALMRSMSGEAQASIGQGELLGLDLGGMIRNLDVGYRGEGAKTVFNAITASATIAGGVASNTDLNFDAPLLRATGSGTVDIGNQSVSYRIVPVALTGGNGITVPVIVEGPWSDVSVRPDLEAILNQNLAAEREAIEQQVRSQAEEALRRELGVDTSTTGGDVEQAVRDRVDQQADELRNQVGQQLLEGLGGLLGGGN